MDTDTDTDSIHMISLFSFNHPARDVRNRQLIAVPTYEIFAFASGPPAESSGPASCKRDLLGGS